MYMDEKVSCTWTEKFYVWLRRGGKAKQDNFFLKLFDFAVLNRPCATQLGQHLSEKPFYLLDH